MLFVLFFIHFYIKNISMLSFLPAKHLGAVIHPLSSLLFLAIFSLVYLPSVLLHTFFLNLLFYELVVLLLLHCWLFQNLFSIHNNLFVKKFRIWLLLNDASVGMCKSEKYIDIYKQYRYLSRVSGEKISVYRYISIFHKASNYLKVFPKYIKLFK